MRQRALQVSAIVFVAAALFGCSDDPNSGGPDPAGSGALPPGTTAPGVMMGTQPPAGTAGATTGAPNATTPPNMTGMTTPPVMNPMAGSPANPGNMGAGSGAMDPTPDPMMAGSGSMMAGSGTGTAGTMAPAAMGSCGPESTVSIDKLGDPMGGLGPWKPMHVERTGPTGASWIFYPEGMGKDGLKHPVFQWGPGAGTTASNYLDHLNLLASQGFVIISQASTNSGKAALDWILKQNETMGSMWFGKLDPNRVARGGHSMGALQSFSEANDPRLKFAVLVCGGAGGGSGAANMTYPTIFLGGVGEGGTRNFEGDYAQVKGLSVFVTKNMTDHIACARNNLAPWVAFMRWQFCGEEAKWKKELTAGSGTFCKSPWVDCKNKMF